MTNGINVEGFIIIPTDLPMQQYFDIHPMDGDNAKTMPPMDTTVERMSFEDMLIHYKIIYDGKVSG